MTVPSTDESVAEVGPGLLLYTTKPAPSIAVDSPRDAGVDASRAPSVSGYCWVILRGGEVSLTLGGASDAAFATGECSVCEEAFGFNLPIVLDEGRLSAHLSCAIAKERKRLAANDPTNFIDIVFDGPPSHVAGRFVEVENPNRCSIHVGQWHHRDDGYWVLRIPVVDSVPPSGPSPSSSSCPSSSPTGTLEQVDSSGVPPAEKDYSAVLERVVNVHIIKATALS